MLIFARRFFLASVALACGCARSHPELPNTARPVDEGRAVRLIAQSLVSTGEQPQAGRALHLPSGRALAIDIGVQGHRYGIAYVTAADLTQLNPTEDLPPHMPDGDLAIVQGAGAERDVVVLVMFANDYLYDDLAGDRHERTAIAAESRIERDVRDFVTQARVRKLP